MKIDTTQIPNFDALPDDAKTAILGMEFADAPDMSKFVEKSVFDKKASEASELSKQLKAQMTEEQQAAAEREAAWAEMKARVATLEQEKMEYVYKANYLALGYDDALATDAAKAMASGDTVKVFEIQKKAAEAAEKKLKTELMKNNPHPNGAGGSGEVQQNIALAKKLGKQKNDSLQAANDILKQYM